MKHYQDDGFEFLNWLVTTIILLQFWPIGSKSDQLGLGGA